MCFILRDLKCYGALPQALEIIFECKEKNLMKNNKKKKKALQLQKNFSLDPSYFQHS
jgi:hypothetical protein